MAWKSTEKGKGTTIKQLLGWPTASWYERGAGKVNAKLKLKYESRVSHEQKLPPGYNLPP